MATTSKVNGEPPRIQLAQKNRKPLMVVADDDGSPVLDGRHYLAWHKATGTFYVGGSEPREYLRTRDRLQAIFRFRQWITRQGAETVAVHTPLAPPEDGTLDEIHNALHPLPYFVDHANGSSEAIIHIGSADFWQTVRRVALSEPETFRKETGLRVVDEKPKPSAKLADLLAAYKAKRRQPKPEELQKVSRYWSFFTKSLGVGTVRDITPKLLDAWEDAAYLPFHDGGSPKTLHHRVEYVLRLFNYAITKQIDAEECERVRHEIISRKAELPDLRNPNPQPISVEHFDDMLKVAGLKWRAILLLALNLAYYPVDIRTLPKTAVNLKSGVVIFDRAKTRQTTRVGVLWKRTIAALRAYQKAQPHNAETVFITQYGKPYGAKGFRTTFRNLRKKWGLPDDVEFQHIRDGGYSAAIQGGASETVAKILAGHRIKGMSDSYVKRNPQMVAVACRAIERHYFGSPAKPKRTKKGA